MNQRAGAPRARFSAVWRVLVPTAAGVAAFGASLSVMPWQIALLVGWDVAAAVLIGWVWLSIWRLDHSDTRDLASTEDDFEPTAHVIPILASLASLVGSAFALLRASQESGMVEAAITGLATLTVVLSWLAVNTSYTLRYARLYYVQGGGIDFNESDAPDYRDFAYVAFTLGMTYQVSDTAIRSKVIRRAVLRHGLLSYVFGTAVVAVTINVVAGLLSA